MKAFGTLLSVLVTTTLPWTSASAEKFEPPSKTVTAVLREPLPPEELSCSLDGSRIVIRGTTFEFTVDKATGAVAALQVKREGQPVIRLVEPARLEIGEYRLDSKQNIGETTVTTDRAEKIILKTQGRLKSASRATPDLPYTLASTFYNDGVVVAEVTVLPQEDLAVSGIRHEVAVAGAFRHYLHKTRDSHGMDAPWGTLPKPGESVKFPTLTSCLQIFGPKAALAIFTDRGATLSAAGIESAVVRVKASDKDCATGQRDTDLVSAIWATCNVSQRQSSSAPAASFHLPAPARDHKLLQTPQNPATKSVS